MAIGGYATAADLPQVIPVFPLNGALLLPHGLLPLNIFEPRYLNMVDDAMSGDRLIGMIQTFAVALDWSLLGPLGRLGVHIGPEQPVYRLLSLTLSEVAPILPYLLLVLILIFRPKGLMGKRES